MVLAITCKLDVCGYQKIVKSWALNIGKFYIVHDLTVLTFAFVEITFQIIIRLNHLNLRTLFSRINASVLRE